MRAAVYRSIDTANTFLGLAFPSEVLVVLTVFWVTAVALPPMTGLLMTLAAYVFLRLATAGRPPQYLQHLVLFLVRRSQHSGRFSPASRAHRAPRFPFAPMKCRDVSAPRSRP